MALKDTIDGMNELLSCICEDMQKVAKGNKAACQRVRTNSIKFGKVAKTFRKESVTAAKKGSLKKAKITRKKIVKKKIVRKAKVAKKKVTGIAKRR